MSIRDLSPNTINGYISDLQQWFIYMYDNQFNLSVLEATDDDLNEYFYFRKQEGKPRFLLQEKPGFPKVRKFLHFGFRKSRR